MAPAYTAVRQSDRSGFRVLWVGGLGSRPLPAPGGAAEGTVTAGQASLRFALTTPSGASALDIGRPPSGPGYDALNRALQEILAGRTRHGGALLAPFGIRYVVSAPFDLPRVAAGRLIGQLDLDLLPTQGLTIFRDSKAVPPASVVQSTEWIDAWRAGRLEDRFGLTVPEARPLSGGGERFSGTATGQPSLALLAHQFDSRWTLTPVGGSELRAQRAFGWAVGFGTPPGATAFSVRFHGQTIRTVEVGLMVLLWMGAIWATRRPLRAR